jgi:hypothetical protein
MKPKQIYDISIPSRSITRWPSGATYLGVYEITDMDGQPQQAVKLLWIDKSPNGARDLRRAYFAVSNGDYLGESMS